MSHLCCSLKSFSNVAALTPSAAMGEWEASSGANGMVDLEGVISEELTASFCIISAAGIVVVGPPGKCFELVQEKVAHKDARPITQVPTCTTMSFPEAANHTCALCLFCPVF